jgi:hypothetical protein
LTFYANGTPVHSMPSEPFPGDAVGFLVQNATDVSVESLKISASRKPELDTLVGDLTRMRVFAEPFNDNSQSWALFNDSNAASEIKDGYYYLQNKSKDNAHLARQSVSVSVQRDFIVDCKAVKVAGGVEDGYGIRFGKTGLNESYGSFLISTDGYLAVLKKEGAKTTTSVNWRPCAAINMGAGKENVLQLLKKGDQLLFFINNVRVCTMEGYLLPIQEIALYVEGIQKVGFDSLNISYLVSAGDRKPASR